MNFNIEMFKWFHFQYLVILLLVCDNTILNHQINGKEITEIYDKPCITPDNQPGYCISLTNCSHLQSKLGKFPVLPELVTFLRKSRCDQESVEKTHKVCCSVLNSADTSSFLTSESLLSQHENGKNTTGCGKTNRAVWKLAGGWNSTLDENQQTDSGPKIQATECKSWEFKCDNGQCISKWDACNGTSECEDKSDETCHRCLNTTCGHSRFRCDYGACIYENQQCDGSVDCRDGSDESLRACNITIDETEKEQLIGFEGNFCTVLIPTPDKTITYQCNEKDSQTCGKSGIVHENTVALIKCNTGYYTIYNKTGSSSVCKNTKWVPSIADCFTPADVKAKIRKIQMEPCSEFEFRCSNGQCIYEWFLCDGISDCVDNSDETLRQCSATRCGKEQFRCNYGGCIDAQYRCDGLKQCNDGSDEAPSTCATKQGSKYRIIFSNFTRRRFHHFLFSDNIHYSTNSCAVPQPSQGETITYTCNNNTSNPCQVNGYIPEHSFAVIQCNPGYFLSNNVLSYQSRCINSKWVPQIYQCLKQCGEFTSTNMGGRCYYKGIQISCNSKSFLAGTLIRPKCKVFYTEADTDNTGIGPDYTQFTCDQQGQWNPEITSEYGNRAISCVHECDQNFVQRQFIRTAVVEPEGKSPWQVAIYNVDKILICGGTIIRPKIVLSAAHCFHTDANKGEVNIADYEVVVGKITRDYSLIDNEEQKSFKIRELRFSKKGYFGLSNNFAADIVIIILEQSITYGNLVKPAEYKPDSLYSANPPAEGNPGKVSGWGLDENGDLSRVLMTAYLTFINRENCLKIVPVDIQRFITLDKFCAGSNTYNGSTVLQGDSGGGIFFKVYSTYYLQGIVSVKEGSLTAISAFTDLADHAKWISSVEQEVYNYYEKKQRSRMDLIPGTRFYTESTECRNRQQNSKLMKNRMKCFLNAKNRNFTESTGCPKILNVNTPPFSEAYAWLSYSRVDRC